MKKCKMCGMHFNSERYAFYCDICQSFKGDMIKYHNYLETIDKKPEIYHDIHHLIEKNDKPLARYNKK